MFWALTQGEAPEFRGSLPRMGPVRNTVPAMANHLRPPDRRHARPLGALAVALGVAFLVIAAMSGQSPDNDTTELVQPATEVSTDPTVLGSTIEPTTTLPSAPPASALGFTTTTSDDSSDGDGGGGGGDGGGPAPTTQATTSPTLGPPVAITSTTTTGPTTTEPPPDTTLPPPCEPVDPDGDPTSTTAPCEPRP